MWERFLSDCRDLWRLIRGREPEPVDPFALERIRVALAQMPAENFQDWEVVEFERTGCWWFNPARYWGTEFDWVR